MFAVQLDSATAIIAAGGDDSEGYGYTQVAIVEMYSPALNKWKRVADLPQADRYVAAASLGNAFFVVGETIHAKYDAVSDAWLHIAPLNQPRSELALVELNDSLYAFGGYSGGAVSTAERYDALRNAWTTNRAAQRRAAIRSRMCKCETHLPFVPVPFAEGSTSRRRIERVLERVGLMRGVGYGQCDFVARPS